MKPILFRTAAVAAFAAGAAFLAGWPAADERTARTFFVKIDGQAYEITTGQEIVVPCAHAGGKDHHITAEESETQRFAKRGLQLAYPSSCSLTWDAMPEHLSVCIRHPEGPVLKVAVMAQGQVPADAVERHAQTLKQHLTEAGGADVQVIDVAATLGGVPVPGRQVGCRILGDQRITEVYYHSVQDRTYAVTLDYGMEQVGAAQVLFTTVAKSLRFE